MNATSDEGESPRPKWQRFERLAEKIYGELAVGADVQWDESVRGRESETYRQIDVTIRWVDDDGEQRLSIVQAKDWRKRADINTVGEFAAVVRDVAADQGILVCDGGFSKQAVTYARNIGIQLHTLHDAESRDWSRGLTLPILWVDQHPAMSLNFEAHFDAGDSVGLEDCYVTDPSGGEESLEEAFVRRWNAGELPREPGVEHAFAVEGLVVHARRPDESVVRRQVRSSDLRYVVEEAAWLGQFQPQVCRGFVDHLSGGALVVSHLPLGELTAVRGEDWKRVDDGARVAVSIAGSFVTSHGFQVAAQATRRHMRARFLG